MTVRPKDHGERDTEGEIGRKVGEGSKLCRSKHFAVEEVRVTEGSLRSQNQMSYDQRTVQVD
jgi:hypothetical protein